MGRDLLDALPETADLVETASSASGLDIRRLMLKGPLTALSDTRALQPAITAVNLACMLFLESRGIEPLATAGHSLGEYTALACAGCIEPREAVSLTALRGRLMADAAARRPGAMYAVIGLDSSSVEDVLRSMVPRDRGGVANLNSPEQVVISGEVKALEPAVRELKSLKAKVVRLNVSGAWHSELMEPVEPLLGEALDRLEIHAPRIKLYMNITGSTVRNPDDIKVNLRRQLRNVVRWTDIQEGLLSEGVRCFVELGPGRVLRGLLRRTLSDPSSYSAYSAGDVRSLERLSLELR